MEFWNRISWLDGYHTTIAYTVAAIVSDSSDGVRFNSFGLSITFTDFNVIFEV